MVFKPKELSTHSNLTACALVASIAFAFGIALRSFFVVPYSAVLFGVIVAAVCIGAWRIQSDSYAPLFLGLFLIGGVLGVIRLDVATLHDRDLLLEERIGKEVTVEGIIVQEVDERAQTSRITLRASTIDGHAIDTRVLVTAERFPRFSYGDKVKVEGVVTLPQTFTTEFDRTFNYPGYLGARDITYTIPFANVMLLGDGEGNIIIATLLKLKHSFMDTVETLIPEPQAGLAEGITLGVKRALGTDLENAFRTTGIIHIVVLSGYNVTIVAEAIMRLLSYFFLPRTRMLFGIGAIASFAIIAGLSATVVRASIMASLILVARAHGHIYGVLRALIFAGVVMLFINPKLLIFDPGFQLSFLATLGLIFLAPSIEQYFKLVPTKFQIREFFTATIATQLFVLPLLLFLVGELSIVAVLVNVLVLPVVPLAMFTTFISGVLGSISYMLALPFAYLTHLLLSYIIFVVEYFASLSYAAVVLPPFSFWWVVIGYGVLGVLSYCLLKVI